MALAVERQLPLKIVAPAFLAVSGKSKVERKNVQIDESIPALFNDGREPAPVAPAAPVPVEAIREEGGQHYVDLKLTTVNQDGKEVVSGSATARVDA